MEDGLTLFLALVFAHALADYPLQGDYLARAKDRRNPLGANGVWIHALAAHSIIHGGFVALITGVWWLGVAEAVVHGVTDMAKTEGVISYHQDQAFHLAWKAVWVGAVFAINA